MVGVIGKWLWCEHEPINDLSKLKFYKSISQVVASDQRPPSSIECLVMSDERGVNPSHKSPETKERN